MSEIQNIFQREDNLSHNAIRALDFDKLQGYGANGKLIGMDIVLKTKQEDDTELQVIIPIPSGLIERYKYMIQATLMNLKLDIDIMEQYQSVIGTYIKKVILRLNDLGESEAWVFTTSDLGETAYFRLPLHMAVIHAITHHLPILAEQGMLREKSMTRSLQDVQKYLQQDVLQELKLPKIMQLMIEQEEENREFLAEITDEEIKNSLSVTELEGLRDIVVELEKYEWAKRFTDIIKEKRDEKE